MTATAPLVTVTVPGKVMLAGEYTVLAGGAALAATIDRRLTVTVTHAPGLGGCRVHSDLWAAPRLVEWGMDGGEPLVAAVARGMRLYGVSDCEVAVRSELDPRHGVGSSAALRLGVMAALSAVGAPPRRRRGRTALWNAALEAFRLQREHQRQASGYDIATQVKGGLTLFTPGHAAAGARGPVAEDWPGATTSFTRTEMQALKELVHVYVGGAGAPTGPVLQDTLAWLDRSGRLPRLESATATLLAALGRALAGPSDASASGLARACAAHRAVFAGSPHFPEALAGGLAALAGESERWSFKTTGAGGEDALLLFGRRAALAPAHAYLAERGWHSLGAAFTSTGARVTVHAPSPASHQTPGAFEAGHV
jgi:phosphomevalonate kinase